MNNTPTITITKDLILKETRETIAVIGLSIFMITGFCLPFVILATIKNPTPKTIIGELAFITPIAVIFGYFIGLRNILKIRYRYKQIKEDNFTIVRAVV